MFTWTFPAGVIHRGKFSPPEIVKVYQNHESNMWCSERKSIMPRPQHFYGPPGLTEVEMCWNITAGNLNLKLNFNNKALIACTISSPQDTRRIVLELCNNSFRAHWNKIPHSTCQSPDTCRQYSHPPKNCLLKTSLHVSADCSAPAAAVCKCLVLLNIHQNKTWEITHSMHSRRAIAGWQDLLRCSVTNLTLSVRGFDCQQLETRHTLMLSKLYPGRAVITKNDSRSRWRCSIVWLWQRWQRWRMGSKGEARAKKEGNDDKNLTCT